MAIATGDDALAASRGRAAYRSLAAARDGAAALGNPRLESYATGTLGQLYEQGGRWDEAGQLTRSAIRLAQRANAVESLYLWQWQLGRILRAQGDSAGAIAAHESAIDTLGSVRGDIIAGFGTGRGIFEESVRPLILGLADLQLRESARVEGATEEQRLLVAARDTVELLKAAEFEDYFNDNCLAALQAKRRDLDALPAGTAALYPVVLPDRVELILSIGGRLERFEARVGAEKLERTVNLFRQGLVDPGSEAYLDPAARLYEWLIAPAEHVLDSKSVDTLIVLPSGLLASIPFAALRDGDGFLVERRAIAVAPGLSLIDPQPIAKTGVKALLGGLTQPVDGFPALPYVAAELDAVSQLYPSTVLQDEDLLQDELVAALDRIPFRILHLATHANFEAEASESFLLTYDGRMDMEGLERLVRQSRFRDEPIELLTLSACSTAEGSPRAALGLAGVALKSGARSAFASLWFVNDRSTSLLVSRFYAELAMPGVSKAEALRQAQLSLIAGSEFRHPSYWAAFLVIGNWL
jgi:CHAT domain-containing protein